MGKLPKRPSEPVSGILAFRWLIHGHPKVGKTCLASQFPNPLFIQTEPGCKALSVYGVQVKSWSDVEEVAVALEEESHNFKTVVIDTLDRLFDLIYADICEKYHVPDIGKLPYGQGYAEANNRILKLLDYFESLELCVVLVCHSKYVKDDSGPIEIQRLVPALSDSAAKKIVGWVDNVVFLNTEYYEDDETEETKLRRIAYCQGGPGLEAGGRLPYLPERIILDPTPAEGYQRFQEAVDNACEKMLADLSAAKKGGKKRR